VDINERERAPPPAGRRAEEDQEGRHSRRDLHLERDSGADYSGDPPEGWVFLRVGRPDPVQKAVHTLVEAALCAEHAAELELNLEQPVDPALLSDPEGRA
jgi:hypothetical protein